MVKKKITYIISDIDKALSFEWIATYINKEQFILSFILLNPGRSVLEDFLILQGYEVYYVRCRGKKDWLKAILETYRALKTIRPDAVHCHLIQANIIGLTAAKLAGVRNRLYTRHHSSYHHVYFKKGVLWDKLSNKLSTKIIAISGIVQKILLEWEKVPNDKVVLLPHGFLLDHFDQVEGSRIEQFRERQSIKDKAPVIGVISRFNELKGIQYIIPAFSAFLKMFPNAVLLLFNASGDYAQVIHEALKGLPVSSYRLINFERDIMAAYKAMDAFIHVPIDEHSEAFGQIYVEALAAGVPSIFTRSGIANEKIFSNENSVLVEHKSADAILAGLKYIFEDEQKTRHRVEAGKCLSKEFDLKFHMQGLEKIYSAL